MGGTLGKGLVFRGDWCSKDDIEEPAIKEGINSTERQKLPFSVWGAATVKVANKLFYIKEGEKEKYIGMYRATFPFAYNSIYHVLYGKNGFVELQFAVPNQGASLFMEGLTKLFSKGTYPWVMIAIKGFKGNSKALSPSTKGDMIAINLYHSPALEQCCEKIYELAIQLNAQPNLSKNSVISESLAKKLLPHYASFKKSLEDFDSNRLYSSELSKKVGL